MEEKWADVRRDLITFKDFSDYDYVTVNTLQTRWKREKKEVSDRLGLDREGSNLSGLPDVDEMTSTICTMILEENMMLESAKHEKEKIQMTQREMDDHEDEILEQHNLSKISVIDITPDKIFNSIICSDSDNSKNISNTKRKRKISEIDCTVTSFMNSSMSKMFELEVCSSYC